MKKILTSVFVATLLLGAGAAQAQLSAGHLLVGGSAGYSKDTPADSAANRESWTTTGNFSPRAGYFIKDNLVVGLDITFRGTRSVSDIDVPSSDGNDGFEQKETTTTTTRQFGPFVRYYKPVSEKAAFFGHLGLAGVKHWLLV